MYSFAFGGDIVRYFMRYRDKLDSRADIMNHSGLSPGDRAVLHSLYPSVHRPDGSARFGNRITVPSDGFQVEYDRFMDQLFRGLIRICRGDASRQVRDVG